MNGSAMAIAVAVFFILVLLWLSMRANIRAASTHIDFRADPETHPCSNHGTPAAPQRAPLREPIDLRQFLCDFQSTYESKLARHGLRLELEMPSMPLTVAVCEADLQRVFAHIVRELCEAPAQAATLRVLARSDGAQAVINCVDAGGPAPLLSRFLAADSAARPSTGATCRTIVNGLGGRLYAAPSPLGQQSLTLRLPLLRINNHSQQQP